MLATPSLLVVDDEELYCEGCRRIFSRQGFDVEESHDANEGLDLAKTKDYAAILLDIKMPTMDGMEFLKQLRTSKPSVPVILMTGYPSIPNAASAVRLGASDYVTKPFTPEEITRAVRKFIGDDSPTNGSESADTQGWTPVGEDVLFLDSSWMRVGHDGSVRVGATLPPSPPDCKEELVLPKIGEAVYEGLPLLGLKADGEIRRSTPSPVSGVVIAVNPRVAEDPSLLWKAPCTEGWIACIAPTRSEPKTPSLKPRPTVLVNSDPATTEMQVGRLKELGCQVRTAASLHALESLLPIEENAVLLVDAASLKEDGPELVTQVKLAAPSLRLVVLASPDSQWETDYRQRKISYYAVEAFTDDEIVDILNSMFREKPSAPPIKPAVKGEPQPLSTIRITNRNGHRVTLFAPFGLLKRDQGLGLRIRQKLVDRLFPIETSLGSDPADTDHLLATTKGCDQLFVVVAAEGNRIPGSLIHDTKGEFVDVPDQSAEKVATLAIEPVSTDAGLTGLDERTVEALATYVVEEMSNV